MACKYKDALGKPGEKAHKIRIPLLDVALVDVALTLAVAVGISLLTNWPVWLVFLVLLVLGIAVHRIFCVRTKVDRALFPYAQ